MGQIGKNNTANWKHNFKIKKTIWIPKQAYEIKVYSIWHVSLKYKVVDKVTFIAEIKPLDFIISFFDQ